MKRSGCGWLPNGTFDRTPKGDGVLKREVYSTAFTEWGSSDLTGQLGSRALT